VVGVGVSFRNSGGDSDGGGGGGGESCGGGGGRCVIAMSAVYAIFRAHTVKQASTTRAMLSARTNRVSTLVAELKKLSVGVAELVRDNRRRAHCWHRLCDARAVEEHTGK
jgi:hypothetical protein